MTQLVVLDPQREFVDRLDNVLAGEAEAGRQWHVTQGGDGPDVDPDATVVVLGPSLSHQTQLEWARILDLRRPDVSVVICAEPTADMISRALPLGVRDVVAPEASVAEFVESITRARDAADRRRRAALASIPGSLVDLGGPLAPHRVITVLSPKGGAGKTTLATNLAVGLAQANPGEVVIVDLDVQFGDVAGALSLTPEHTLIDAARRGERLDLTTLKVFLTPHSSGLFALCAPESLVDADDIGPDDLKPLLTLLSDQFRYVIIDTSAGIRDDTLAALDVSTDFVLVCSTDVPSVRGLQRQLAAFESLKLTDQRRLFVINRSNARVGLSVPDIEATIGLRADVTIPSSRAVVVSTNQGRPVVEDDSREPVRRSLQQLVDAFLPVRPETANGNTSGNANGNGKRRWRER